MVGCLRQMLGTPKAWGQSDMASAWGALQASAICLQALQYAKYPLFNTSSAGPRLKQIPPTVSAQRRSGGG